MSKKIWCDLCGKELGTEHKVGIGWYPDEPSWEVFSGGKKTIDYCRECEKELVDVVHKKLEELRKKKEVK